MSAKRTKIYVSPDVYEKTPSVLLNLLDANYRLSKVANLEKPVHCTSRIVIGVGYEGDIMIVNRGGGGPSISIGRFSTGRLITSCIIEAMRVEDDQIKVITENSVYLIEGPLPEKKKKRRPHEPRTQQKEKIKEE